MYPTTDTIRLSTEIARPRGDVWEAFAGTEARQQWSAPAGERVVYDRDDFRTGGRAEYRCGSPEALEYSAAIDYIHVEVEDFAVHTDTVWRGDDLLVTGMVTWSFTDVPAGTLVTIVNQVVSFVGTDMIDGSRNGHRIALEQLGAFFAGPGEVRSSTTDGDGRPA